MKRIILLILMSAFFITATAYAQDEVVLFNGETVEVDIPVGAKAESENELVAKVENEEIVAGNSGETTISIKEKKFLIWKEIKEIPVKVVDGGTMVIEPREDISFMPQIRLYDKQKREVKAFAPNEQVKVPAGQYFVREKTGYSTLHNDYQEVSVKQGKETKLSINFVDIGSVQFTATESKLNGSEVDIYNKSGEKLKTLKIDNGKTERVKLRSGNYFWVSDDKVSPTGNEQVNGKTASQFTISGETEVVLYPTAEYTSVNFSEDSTENAKYIYSKLTGTYGVGDIQTRAIIGNMYGESGIRTGAKEKGGGGHGLCQWTGGRWTNLQNYAKSCGKPWTDIDTQIDFLMVELGNYSLDSFWGSQSVEEATEIFMRHYERPAEWVYATSLPKRIGAARNVYKSMGGEI